MLVAGVAVYSVAEVAFGVYGVVFYCVVVAVAPHIYAVAVVAWVLGGYGVLADSGVGGVL